MGLGFIVFAALTSLNVEDEASDENPKSVLALIGMLVELILVDSLHIFGFFVIFRDYDYINLVLLNPESKMPKV